MATTLRPVKVALMVAMRAVHASDPDEVHVVYGPPDADTIRLERLVAVGGVQAGQAPPDSLDLGSAGEFYVVTITTSVDLPVAGSEGQQVATEQVVDMYQREQDYLREGHDGQLGLLGFGVLGLRPADGFELLERASDKGRSAAVRWGVQVIGQRQ